MAVSGTLLAVGGEVFWAIVLLVLLLLLVAMLVEIYRKPRPR